MNGTFLNYHADSTNNENSDSLGYMEETFKAFVDAIIPRTPRLEEEYGKIQYFGALDSYTYEYIIWTLNYYISLGEPTAELLDLAAERLLFIDGNSRLLNFSHAPIGGAFAVISARNRFRALTLLEQFKIYLAELPGPFQNNPGYILNIIGTLNRLTMMGYYSEWSGYGSTRLETPNKRKLEHFPISWKQVGYPGPSLGYRVLRK